MRAGYSRISDRSLRLCAVLPRRDVLIRREKKSVLIFYYNNQSINLISRLTNPILRKMSYKAASGYSALNRLKVALNADSQPPRRGYRLPGKKPVRPQVSCVAARKGVHCCGFMA